MSTKIEWCRNPDGTPGETINPIIGCTKCSPGCEHCYAERMAARLKRIPATGLRYLEATDDAGHWTGKMMFVPSELEKPLRWKKPRRIFVGSMGDVFHKHVPMLWLDALMESIDAASQHTFILLTKRPDRMQFYFAHMSGWCETTPPNLWLGVTVENQQAADERIPLLLNTPAAVRFISVEPMLSHVDLSTYLPVQCTCGENDCRCISGASADADTSLDLVICGAETGPGARPMDLDWARSLRDQCVAAGTPYFFKKDSDGRHLLDGQTWEQMPGGEA